MQFDSLWRQRKNALKSSRASEHSKRLNPQELAWVEQKTKSNLILTKENSRKCKDGSRNQIRDEKEIIKDSETSAIFLSG